MKKIYFLILIFVLLSFISAQGKYTISNNLSQFKFSSAKGYDRVKGIEMSAITDPGVPELPVKSLNFILPNGKRAKNVEVISIDLIPLSGTYNIYPTQPSVPMSAPPPPWVPQNPKIYSKDELYPNSVPIQVIHQGKLDGIPVVTVAVYPLLYNPVKNKVYLVQSVTWRFKLESVPMSQRPQIRGVRIHQLYKNSIKSSVYNQWEVDAFYTASPLMSDEQILSEAYYEVVIVTTSTMADAYESLADWLTEKGMPCVIKTTEWIYANYDGHWDESNYAGYSYEHIGDNAAKIKEFLYHAYHSYGLCYAILGGILQLDAPLNTVPFRYCWMSDNLNPPNVWIIPGDLYFQDFSGNWEVDGDDRIGEPNDDSADVYEEIYIGRVPAWDYDQALSWVEKRLTYERTPVNRTEMIHSLWISQANEPSGWPFETLMEQTIEMVGFPEYFIQHKLVDFPCIPSDHRLIDTLSIGYGIASHYGHGSGDALRTSTYNYPPRQLLLSWDWDHYPSLDELYNINKYYIFYSISCEPAWFDTSTSITNVTGFNGQFPEPCIAEGFVSFYRHSGPPPNGYPSIGATAFIGNTRPAWTPSFYLHRNFLFHLFYDFSVTNEYGYIIGIAEANSKYSGIYGWSAIGWPHAYMNNLFGSPEMEVWTNIPKRLFAEHRREIPANTPYDFKVRVSNEDGFVEGALVTLYKKAEVYKSKKTDSDGRVLFENLTVPSPGIMKVTVTKRNHIPYQGKVDVYEGDATQTLITIPEDLVFSLRVFPTVIRHNSRLQYSIPISQKIRLNFYDVSGRKIKSIANGVVKPGIYTYNLDSSNLSSGIYFLILEGKEKTITEKILVVR
ncbi:T9SS type A sorting domain-containing protein [candidate division WOR-3 bacterium]|nr:T9SS type A sorting domain-containing protein [candidate division WOR-3 bacterium]